MTQRGTVGPARRIIIPVVVVTTLGLMSCGRPAEEPAIEAIETDEGEVADASPANGAEAVPRGLRTKTPAAEDGYVYFAPLLSDTTYLINMDGQVVHTWKSDYAPSAWVYQLDNGDLLRGGREPDVPVFSGGGQGGRIQQFTWDGELVWDFSFANEDHLLHHDVAILPNGNLLALAWEPKTVEESGQAGRRPEMTPEAGVWPDMILEFEPQPPDNARIVWEWHMWDHTVQDYDESLANYGNPSDHPELVDINAGGEAPELSDEELARLRALGYVPPDTTQEDLSSDLMHTNAIFYNPHLDQIAISVHRYSEMWIIDHSTTTTEAAGRTGGRWERGGDLLYRWGNPSMYDRGDADDQQLFAQHDVRWISEGLPGAGHILVFNNNNPGPDGQHSAVVELEPPADDMGRYVIPETAPYGPTTPLWSYTAPDKTSFHSNFISGAQRLPNGHTLITSGAQGRFFEVTPEGEIVWEYATPYSGNVRLPDGSPPHPVGESTYAVFRATKVPVDHPALAGRNLAPLDPQPEIVTPD